MDQGQVYSNRSMRLHYTDAQSLYLIITPRIGYSFIYPIYSQTTILPYLGEFNLFEDFHYIFWLFNIFYRTMDLLDVQFEIL